MTFSSLSSGLRDLINNRQVRQRSSVASVAAPKDIVSHAVSNGGMSAWHSIPEPEPEVESLRRAVLALKEGYEELHSERGNKDEGVVSIAELANILEVFADYMVSEMDKRYAPK